VFASAFSLGGSQAGVTSSGTSPRGILPNFAAQGSNLIRLQVGAFDPLSDLKPPGALGSLTSDSTLPSGTVQYWLLQVDNHQFARARQAVARAGAKVAGVVPDATFLV